MVPVIRGSCLCGGVTYDIYTKPTKVIRCFCIHCRKGSGGTSQLVAQIDASAFTITKGEDVTSTFVFRDTHSGKPKEKSFCKVCGCTLWTEPATAKGKFFYVRASLFGDELLEPNMEFFTERRPAWVPAVPGATQADLEGHL